MWPQMMGPTQRKVGGELDFHQLKESKEKLNLTNSFLKYNNKLSY